jgi:sigma-54 dependent transcriptional regulator, acetoin dehydrogenase operon transcriptional activator AcoR
MVLENELKAIWNDFISGEPFPASGIRREIGESWVRCKKSNVDPNLTSATIILHGEALAKQKDEYRNLISISRPIMEDLYHLVIGGGFIVSLSDPGGILLEIVGDKIALEDSRVVGFIPGTSWAEDMVGTNSVGTPLFLDKPIQLSRSEHYCRIFQKWAGSGAPIHGPSGKTIGTLNICGPAGKVHAHTLGIVVTAVSAIESRLKVDQTMNSLLSADNYKNTIIESISEGLIAINSDRMVTHINEVLASTFGLRKEEVLNRNLLSFFSRKDSAYHIVNAMEQVTDYEMTFQTEHGKITGLITTRPIVSRGNTVGMLLLFKDIARARRLIQRLSGKETKLSFYDLLGKDAKFLEMVELAKAASKSNSNILLLGESGSGKDIFAQSIHNASSRKKGAFVALNCAAIPRELIASELFGYVEGAYTGARRGGKPGKFELAGGGTIFLDEIGEMPLELQTTFLRVLESRTITRVGGSDVIPVDVRIIAATNRDLAAAVLLGHFRQDLFYRLNVFSIHMVPLRERKIDIPILVDHFLKSIGTKLNRSDINQVSPDVIDVFNRYNWPGNIRELQNVMERAINICNGTVLLPEHLTRELLGVSEPEDMKTMDNYESDLIRSLLAQHKNNVSRVAKAMGVARTTLYRKFLKYNLDV